MSGIFARAALVPAVAAVLLVLGTLPH